MNSLKPGKIFRDALIGLNLVYLTGCRGAPSINLLGSFFPSWMLCVGVGVAVSVAVRQVFIKTGVEKHLPARMVVYLCLWGLITLLTWLLFFRS
jgi:hypothetical protein